MTPEKTKALLEAGTTVFFDKEGGKTLSWGFECGEGWFEPILKLTQQLEVLNRKTPENCVVCVQCKEKFGGLRFYISNYTPEAEELVRHAEKTCASTCEECGAQSADMDDTGGWLRTLCKECTDARRTKRQRSSSV